MRRQDDQLPRWSFPAASPTWNASHLRNAARTPPDIPLRPQGGRWVLVHLVWDMGEEIVPARAVRWTNDRVMVMVPDPYGPQNAPELCVWLDARDVFRTLPRR